MYNEVSRQSLCNPIFYRVPHRFELPNGRRKERRSKKRTKTENSARAERKTIGNSSSIQMRSDVTLKEAGVSRWKAGNFPFTRRRLLNEASPSRRPPSNLRRQHA